MTEHPTAHWTAQQIVNAFPDETAPSYLLRDRDQVYGAQFRHRVKGMHIKEVLTAPQSPWQNPFAERLIGSVRRECLDHVLVLSERHLRASSPSTFRTITGLARIWRSPRMRRLAGPSSHQRWARSSRSPKSVACIIDTYAARHSPASFRRPTRTAIRGDARGSLPSGRSPSILRATPLHGGADGLAMPTGFGVSAAEGSPRLRPVTRIRTFAKRVERSSGEGQGAEEAQKAAAARRRQREVAEERKRARAHEAEVVDTHRRWGQL